MRTSVGAVLLAVLAGLGFMPSRHLTQELPHGPTPVGPPAMEPIHIRPRPPSGRTRFPGEPGDTDITPRKKAPDLAKAKLQADELANLARKLPDQVHQLSNNTLPKDLIGDLKRIEKLAKELRKQLAP